MHNYIDCLGSRRSQNRFPSESTHIVRIEEAKRTLISTVIYLREYSGRENRIRVSNFDKYIIPFAN